MKRILSLVLALLLVFVMAGCSSAPEATVAPEATDAAGTEAPAESEAPAEETPAESEAPAANADFKVGFIFLHDENSTYDKNFMDAATAVQQKLGLTDEQVMFKTNIPESNECYEAAAEPVSYTHLRAHETD